MLIRVWSKLGREHLWAYENFKEETKAILVDYSLTGSIIKNITYSVPDTIPQDIFDKYDFNYSIVDINSSHKQYLPIINDTHIVKKKSVERYKPKFTSKAVNINPKCDSCLFWNDDTERCEKSGECK